MAKYIDLKSAIALAKDIIVPTKNGYDYRHRCIDPQDLADLPAADVVEEENILKFYYVRSIDEYWIGRRIDNFYYAEYDPKSRQWVWTHSRYLPWGEHIVSPTSLWKEHTYPSKPEEIPFAEWFQGFIKKHADVVERKTGKWISYIEDGYLECPFCGAATSCDGDESELHFCFSCGAKMEGVRNDV